MIAYLAATCGKSLASFSFPLHFFLTLHLLPAMLRQLFVGLPCESDVGGLIQI